MNNRPLVSVCVICYNSCDTVVETLESVKKQTYNNIELIVTDDCSTDNTVDICKQWIANNKQYFVNACVVTSAVNTGMSANYNRAVKQARGEWVKTIDGDDTLRPNCVEDLLKFAVLNNSDIVFSQMRPFGANVDAGVVACKDLSKVFEELTPRECLMLLTHFNFLPSPGSFIKYELFNEIGLFDESIPFIEDWPFWIKALYNNCSLDYLNKQTVNYRIHGESVSQQKSKRIIELFTDSRIKAISYAYKIGSELGVLQRLYYTVLMLKYKKRALRFVSLLNFLNPYTYRVVVLRRKFNKLIGDQKV